MGKCCSEVERYSYIRIVLSQSQDFWPDAHCCSFNGITCGNFVIRVLTGWIVCHPGLSTITNMHKEKKNTVRNKKRLRFYALGASEPLQFSAPRRRGAFLQYRASYGRLAC